MLRRFVSVIGLYLAILVLLGGCTEGSSPGFLEVPELSLSNITIDGADIYSNDELVTVFDPNKTGPYEATVANDVENIIITATVAENTASGSELELFRVSEVADSDDGRIRGDVELMVSGQGLEVSLDEGINVFYVRLRENKNNARLSYILEVNRVGTDSSLSFINYYIDGTRKSLRSYNTVTEFKDSDEKLAYIEGVSIPASDEGATTPGEFDPEAKDYYLAAKYDVCFVGMQPLAEQKRATISINTSEIQTYEVSKQDLVDGLNAFVVDITAEDGVATSQYNLRVERLVADAEELATDPRLKSMTFSGGKLSPEFRCDTRDDFSAPLYLQQIRFDQDFTSINLNNFTPNTEIYVGKQLFASDGEPVYDAATNQLFLTEEAFQVTPGVDFPASPESEGGDLFNVEAGASPERYVVTTIFTDEEGVQFVRQYLFGLARSKSNWVEVDSVESLTVAIANAKANDEIVLLNGDYQQTGLAADVPQFTLAASGTAEAPIKIRAITTGGAVLRGTDNTLGSVLSVVGDHWEIQGLVFADALTAISYSGANYTNINLSVFENIGGRGIVMDSASSNNIIQFVDFSNIGKAGISVADEYQGEAVVIGFPEVTGQTAVANVITNSIFNDDIVAEFIDVKPAAANTLVTLNQFVLGDQKSFSDLDSAIKLSGSESELSFNNFVDSTKASAPATNIVNVSAEAVGVFEAKVFSNRFGFSRTTAVNAINAGASRVEVVDNLSSDGGAVTITGDNISVKDSVPRFTIRSASESNQCLTFETVEFDRDEDEDQVDITTPNVLMLSECISATNQIWQFEYDDTGFVVVRLASDTIKKIYPSRLGSADFITLVRDDHTDDVETDREYLNEGNIYRWRLLRRIDGTIALLNKDALSTAITPRELSANYITDKKGAVVLPYIDDIEFGFTLIGE